MPSLLITEVLQHQTSVSLHGWMNDVTRAEAVEPDTLKLLFGRVLRMETRAAVLGLLQTGGGDPLTPTTCC